MDVMGINNTDEQQLQFIKHSSKNKCFMAGENKLNIQNFIIDPATIKIGWGVYEGIYDYVWDEKPGVRCAQPTPEWKRAFSIEMYTSAYGAMLWRNFTWGETQGVNKMLSLIWDDINANAGKVAAFTYTGVEDVNFKVGSSSVPQFTFKAWLDRPAEFVMPSQDAPPASEPEDPFNGLTNDDLPF